MVPTRWRVSRFTDTAETFSISKIRAEAAWTPASELSATRMKAVFTGGTLPHCSRQVSADTMA